MPKTDNKKKVVKKQLKNSSAEIYIPYSAQPIKKSKRNKTLQNTPKRMVHTNNKPSVKKTNKNIKDKTKKQIENTKKQELKSKKVENQRKKNKNEQGLSLITVSVVAITLTFFAYFSSVTILRAHNVLLTREIGRIEYDNSVVFNINENIRVELAGLQDRSRIIEVGLKNGYYVDDKHIYVLKSEEENTEEHQ